jgi:hypothetical protein
VIHGSALTAWQVEHLTTVLNANWRDIQDALLRLEERIQYVFTARFDDFTAAAAERHEPRTRELLNALLVKAQELQKVSSDGFERIVPRLQEHELLVQLLGSMQLHSD